MAKRAGTVAIVVTSIVASLLAVTSLQSVSAADPAPDGTTEATAAPSCWAIKQNHTSSADGDYWLLTPELGAPQRFYCDMTTDGGGWVLIGRGRNGWTWDHAGQGNPDQIADVPDGVGAFTPAALPGDTIDALLAGTSVKDLDDGVRIRRAANTAGTSWQEVRWDFSVLDTWAWGFPGGMLLSSTTVDGTTYPGGNTRDSLTRRSGQPATPLTSQNNERRVFTYLMREHAWNGGFSYGSSVSGSSASNSYLWTAGTERHALPFSQVFIRPKVTDVTFAPLPAAGTPAEVQRPLMQNTTEGPNQQWGVTGVMPGSSPDPNEVQAFAQIGNTVFVGGKFQYVQQGSSGTRVEQRHLAAFDATTGAWLSGFRPTIGGNVWALQATPDGRLIVGGEFSTVNGQPAGGLVALDPATGATLSSWSAHTTPVSGATRPWVRALDIDGPWIYVGGRFNSISGGVPSTGPITLGSVARVRWSDGRPDGAWKPNSPASVADLSVDDAGEYVYLAGFFESVSGVATESVAKISTTTPPVVTPWNWTPSASKSYQQAILATGGKVYHGGSEHNIDAYDADTQTLLRRHLTLQGGDFQAVALIDGVIYAGCHCGDQTHADVTSWPSATNPSRTDNIRYVGAWDAETFEPIPEFNVEMGVARGQGVWAIHHDQANGCMWLGGDMNRGSWVGGGWQWAGGFVRVCARDTTAPATPSGLTAVAEGTSARLTWAASTDDRGGAVAYEVLRDDRAIATVTGLTFLDTGLDDGRRYAVRAVDAAGNRSASTPVEELVPPPADATIELVEAGATWSWRWETAAPPADWAAADFDDSSWSTGAAPLGYGSADLGTTISGPSPRPLAVYLRHDVAIDDPAELTAVTITTRADDGVVVLVNGVEVGRSNMPAGTIHHNSYSLDSPRTSVAAANPVTFVVPPSLLQAGENTIAAQVQLGYRNTRDISFELTALGLVGSGETTPPVAPTPAASLVSDDTVELTWPAIDDVVAYRVQRDGEQVAFVTAPTTAFLDTGLAAGATYAYSVTAIDDLGNESSPGTVSISTPTDPAVTLVAAGSSWRWRWEAAAPPAGWASTGFDDSSWATGTAPLGYGSAGLGTTITGPTPRPLAAYFRHSVDVADPSALSAVTITTRADDGVVVYVNGVEVGRSNMPAGAIGHGTYSLSSPNTTFASSNPVTFTVPPSLLQAGENTIAAQVQLGYRNTRDISFELTAAGLAGSPDTTPPAAPTPSATLVDETTVELAWTPVDEAIAYRVLRDGAQVAFVAAPSASFTDTGLARGATYGYAVSAIDAVGNESASGTVSIATPVDPTVSLVAAGSTWRWLWQTDAPPADWAATSFDDSSWAAGAAPLGYGSASLGTTITGPTPRPLAAYFRHSFDLADPASLASVTLTTRADDGVVVFVNGVEVGRSNMPAGTIGHGSYSLSSPNTAFASSNPVTFAVPMELLQAGTNTISAQVQLGYRNTRDISFELSALGLQA